MKLAVNFQGGTRYEITSGNHRVITDQPAADGGQDTGMSPVELFVGSVASCVGYFVGRFCARHDIPLEGLKVEAEWALAESPHRVGAIELALSASSHHAWAPGQTLKSRLGLPSINPRVLPTFQSH